MGSDLTDPRNRWVDLVKCARTRARRKGLAWDEPFMQEHFVRRCPTRCDYTGVEFDFRVGFGRGGAWLLSPSIDRIDSRCGYVRGNAVAACWGINCGKSDYGIEDLELSHMLWHRAMPELRRLMPPTTKGAIA